MSARSEVARLWEATAEADVRRLNDWVDLVELYERRTARPERPVDPVEVIKADMELDGRTRGDLAALPGQNRATEILARRRPLTLAMIRRLKAAWGVPADLLIGAYETAARAFWNGAAELSAAVPGFH